MVLIGRLKAGESIAARDFRSALTVNEYAGYVQMRDRQKAERATATEKPESVVEYERLLKRADFLHNKSEHYSTSEKLSGNKDRTGVRYATSYWNEAQTAYESALTYLQDEYERDMSLEMWFDRQLRFGLDGDLGLNPESVPRSIVSRSRHSTNRKMHVHGMQTADEHKLEVLKGALKRLTGGAATLDEIRRKLREAMKNQY